MYVGTISYAKDNLEILANFVGANLFEECLRAAKIDFYWEVVEPVTNKKIVGSSMHNNIEDMIDFYSTKPGCIVVEFSQICIVKVFLINTDIFKCFWVDADSNYIFGQVSRINNIKAFL